MLTMDLLRPISALLSFNKVQEMIVVGQEIRTGITHYLIRMLHQILSETEKNSRKQIRAVLSTFVDWQQA